MRYIGRGVSNTISSVTLYSGMNIAITSECLTYLTVSWTSNLVESAICGAVSYNVTISQFDQVVQMTAIVNNTHYTFTGLLPATSYTVILYSTNSAGYSVSTLTATTAGGISCLYLVLR